MSTQIPNHEITVDQLRSKITSAREELAALQDELKERKGDEIIGRPQTTQKICELASELLCPFAMNSSRVLFLDHLRASFSVQDIQEAARREIMPTLRKIAGLLAWPDNWNGYDACAPKLEAVQHAERWIELFYLEVTSLPSGWFVPNVTASAEGEVAFEWRNGVKCLTIYIGDQDVDYLKDWGTNVATEMEDGSVDSSSTRKALWRWLTSKEEDKCQMTL